MMQMQMQKMKMKIQKMNMKMKMTILWKHLKRHRKMSEQLGQYPLERHFPTDPGRDWPA
jgi:hypothetical protein